LAGRQLQPCPARPLFDQRHGNVLPNQPQNMVVANVCGRA
jgi:hypothetical protein